MAPKMTTKKTEGSSKSYKDLITEALLSLNDTRKGSSRIALKKYIEQNHSSIYNSTNFDHHFNNAIKKGVETKEFAQPKGASGSIKLIKKDTKPKKPTSSTTATAKKVIKKKVTPATKKTVTKPKAKATTTKKITKPKSPSSGSLTYKEMIANGIKNVNNGKGASRSALKIYIKDTYFPKKELASNFTSLFNTTIKKAVDAGEFSQPKGPSGVVKINKSKK